MERFTSLMNHTETGAAAWLQPELHTAVLSLAFDIGANTAIFRLFDALLFRPLPVKPPEELVLVARYVGDQRSLMLNNGERAPFSAVLQGRWRTPPAPLVLLQGGSRGTPQRHKHRCSAGRCVPRWPPSGHLCGLFFSLDTMDDVLERRADADEAA